MAEIRNSVLLVQLTQQLENKTLERNRDRYVLINRQKAINDQSIRDSFFNNTNIRSI